MSNHARSVNRSKSPQPATGESCGADGHDEAHGDQDSDSRVDVSPHVVGRGRSRLWWRSRRPSHDRRPHHLSRHDLGGEDLGRHEGRVLGWRWRSPGRCGCGGTLYRSWSLRHRLFSRLNGLLGGSAGGAAGAPARVPSGTFSAPYSTGSRALARCGLSLGSLARSQAMRG